MHFSSELEETKQLLSTLLPVKDSFDFIQKDLYIGKVPCFFLGINGFCDTGILQRIFSDLQSEGKNASLSPAHIEEYVARRIGYVQSTLCTDVDTFLTDLLSGPSALFVDGYGGAILLDVRTYPARSMEEPDTERILKGSRDGFVETLLQNTTLIRRRIRSKDLVFSIHKIGSLSKTDVALAYLKGYADAGLVERIKKSLDALNVSALTMGDKSLEELLLPPKWYHPLPGILRTERPDVACSYLAEGYVLLFVDNSPSALVLPCSFFQFTQNPEDYTKHPLIGTYFRLVRFLCIPVSLLLLPLYLLLSGYYPNIAERIELLSSGGTTVGQLTFFCLAVEFFLDLFQYTGALSSSKFSGSLSVVGGLLIGDIAVSLHWASVEVLFYGAITLLCSLAIHHICLSEAIRIYRIFLVTATGLFGLPGFSIAFFLTLLSVITTPTFGAYAYFWPLHPWNSKALFTLLFRRPTTLAQPSVVWPRSPRQKGKKD